MRVAPFWFLGAALQRIGDVFSPHDFVHHFFMESRTYRKRNQRQKTTGYLRINESRRDRVIEPLTRYARLPTNYLEALYGSSHIKEILKRLYHETAGLPAAMHILERADEINRNVGTYLFHELGAGAYAHTGYTEDFIRRTKIGKNRRSAHDTHICMIVAQFEATLGERFVSHLDILDYAKCPPSTRDAECPVSFPLATGFMEPDALFGDAKEPSVGPHGYKFYAVELDRMTESLSIIDRKLENYAYVLERKTHEVFLGIPNFRIMWLTHSAQREAHIRARINKHHDAHLFNVVPKYNLFDNAPAPDFSLFKGDWRTARDTTQLY